MGPGGVWGQESGKESKSVFVFFGGSEDKWNCIMLLPSLKRVLNDLSFCNEFALI